MSANSASTFFTFFNRFYLSKKCPTKAKVGNIKPHCQYTIFQGGKSYQKKPQKIALREKWQKKQATKLQDNLIRKFFFKAKVFFLHCTP
jgi:hypothetical protein